MGLLIYANSRIEHDPEVRVDPEPVERERPINVLILGSDTREGLTEEEQARIGTPEDVDGERSDTIILAHFDPRRDQAVLVHFPRDLLVEIPGNGRDKINAAFTVGGADLTVQTVRQLTGLKIHHFVQVDFIGFRQIVEALGGVRICVSQPMHDPLAGLNLPTAGCYDMHGEMALAFVRARNVEGDVIPDFARIARQQQFIRAVMNKVFSLGSLTKVQGIITAVADNVTTDAQVEVSDLFRWGQELQGLAEEDRAGAPTVDLRVVPGHTETIDGISFVVMEPEAEQLFAALAEGGPLGEVGSEEALSQTPISPAQIEVRVLDAGAPNRAARQERRLRDAGFIVLPTADSPRPASQIVFVAGARPHAERVGEFFPTLELNQVPRGVLSGAQVGVVVGRDFGEEEA